MSSVISDVFADYERKTVRPILIGMVAVSKSWTLVMSSYSFVMALKEAKQDLDAVPERFRLRVENLEIYRGHNLERSDEADHVYRYLPSSKDRIARIDHWGPMRPGGPNGHRGERHVMEDIDAKAYMTKEDLKDNELEWLWMMAQTAHVLLDEPVERR